uniref:Dirigent protein n=1 Tax=Triticum urartu TaxID=4572 RepID=A0A8R7PH55_TRIUA
MTTMQAPAASSKIVLVMLMLGLGLAGAAADSSRRRLVSSSSDEPCKQMTLYLHNILYNGVKQHRARDRGAGHQADGPEHIALEQRHLLRHAGGVRRPGHGGDGAARRGRGAGGARAGFLLLRQEGVVQRVVHLLPRVRLQGVQGHPQPHGRRPHRRRDARPLRRRRHRRLLHGAWHRHHPHRRHRGLLLLPPQDGHQALRVPRLI